MRRVWFLAVALTLAVISGHTRIASADACTDCCRSWFNQGVHWCGSTYAGDSGAIYQCTQEEQALYNNCVARCGQYGYCQYY